MNSNDQRFLDILANLGIATLASIAIGCPSQWHQGRARRDPEFRRAMREAARVGRLKLAGRALRIKLDALNDADPAVRDRAANWVLDRVDIRTGEFRQFGFVAQQAGIPPGGVVRAPVVVQLPQLTDAQVMLLAQSAMGRRPRALDAPTGNGNGNGNGVDHV